MNEVKSNNIFTNIKTFVSNNLRNIIILIVFLFISLAFFQTYIYFSTQQLKKDSIIFFNSIDTGDLIIENLDELRKSNNFYSTLSTLKLIQKNNEENNFKLSNELYKELISSDKISNFYLSSIAVHASYTLINASKTMITKF